jgi:hypothetical protein
MKEVAAGGWGLRPQTPFESIGAWGRLAGLGPQPPEAPC